MAARAIAAAAPMLTISISAEALAATDPWIHQEN